MIHATVPGRRPCVAAILLLVLVHAGQAIAQDAPRVVVSIKPLHALVAGLMAGVAEPVLLVGGEQTPWNLVPDAAQREAIAAADLLIWSGPELEPGLAAAVAARGSDQGVFEVLASELLKVLPARHDDNRRDPFYWLDTRNMQILLDAFARLLIERDPAHAVAYERNWRRTAEPLAAIDREMEFAYRDVSGVPVFFYHDTHQYFAQAYAMHVAGTLAGFPGDGEVDAAQVLTTRNRLAGSGPTCLFTERGVGEPHLDLLLAGTAATPVELDSLGVSLAPGPALYLQLMRNNFAAISACVARIKPPDGAPALADDEPDMRQAPARIEPRYLMRDQYGRAVSNEDFRGRLQLIYFGYTYCPDICPTSLAVMARALRLLGDDAEQVQPIFITVDPERDTPALLKEYLAYFDPRLLGLSAGPEITRRTAELFRARYERVEAESGDPRRYTMDHTASLYLLGRSGEFLTKFAHGLPAADVAARLRDYLAE